MNSYTQMLWKKAVSHFDAIQSFARPVARQIKIPLGEGNVEGLRKVATEGLEAVEAERNFYLALLADTDDGTLDLAETADLAVLLEVVVDEREDQFTGHDEDDPVIGDGDSTENPPE